MTTLWTLWLYSAAGVALSCAITVILFWDSEP